MYSDGVVVNQDWQKDHIFDFCPADGGGAILASFLEQVAITVLHRDPEFQAIRMICTITGAGSTVTMYDVESALVGGLQLMFVERSQCSSVGTKRAWNQTGEGMEAPDVHRVVKHSGLKRWKSMGSPVKRSDQTDEQV